VIWRGYSVFHWLLLFVGTVLAALWLLLTVLGDSVPDYLPPLSVVLLGLGLVLP
jgi:hypothetical protein